MFKKFLAAISISILALVLISCGGSNEKMLLGNWYSETTFPIPANKDGISGEIKVLGVTDYLANKASSFDGQMIIAMNSQQGVKIDIVYDAAITADWEIKGNSIFTKIVDTKFHIASVKINGELIESQDQIAEMEKSFNPADFIPKGTADEEKVISIDSTTLVSESKDLTGKWVRHTATKTEKTFDAYKK